MASSPPGHGRPITVFFSYAHRDEALRNKLAEHLRLLERQGIITGWHDRRITGGTEWAGAIGDHLRTAQLILLLISPTATLECFAKICPCKMAVCAMPTERRCHCAP